MHDTKHHEQLVDGVMDQFKEILENSEQAIYIYLDDEHKACNKKFSTLLGYNSPSEWAKVKEPFPQTFVAEKSQKELVNAYQKAMEKHAGSNISVVWKKKSGGTTPTNVILVPIAFEGHVLAMHFISK